MGSLRSRRIVTGRGTKQQSMTFPVQSGDSLKASVVKSVASQRKPYSGKKALSY